MGLSGVGGATPFPVTKDPMPMTSRPTLSVRQREALWYRAQGLTAQAIGRQLTPPISAAGAQDLLHKAMGHLDASGTANAVFKAMALGIIGPYLDCGTRRSAYTRHVRRGEAICTACRAYNQAAVTGHLPALPPVPGAGHNRGWDNLRPRGRMPLTPRQVTVLLCVRDDLRSTALISRRLGLSQNAVRRYTADLFDRLDVDEDLLGTEAALKQAEQTATARNLLPEGGYQGDTRRLTPEQVQTILACRDESLTLAQAAETLGLSQRVFSSRLHRLYIQFNLNTERGRTHPGRSRRSRLYALALERGLLVSPVSSGQ